MDCPDTGINVSGVYCSFNQINEGFSGQKGCMWQIQLCCTDFSEGSVDTTLLFWATQVYILPVQIQHVCSD